MVRLLIDSLAPETTAFLQGSLSPYRFEVMTVERDEDFIQIVKRERPHLAIIGGVNDASNPACLKVSYLKETCPGVCIIVVSSDSSHKDARIVEQGVHFYTCNPAQIDLVRLVLAQADWLGINEPRRERR